MVSSHAYLQKYQNSNNICNKIVDLVVILHSGEVSELKKERKLIRVIWH